MEKITQEEMKEMKNKIKLEFRKSKDNNIYIVKTHDEHDSTLNLGKELFPTDEHYRIIGKL